MASTELERVILHMKDVAKRSRSAAIAHDLVGFREAVGKFSAVSPKTQEYTASIVPIEGASFEGEWVIHEESDPNRRLLYIHGGGWMSGHPKEYRPLTSRIAEACGCAVLAVDYRLAPENRFPAGLDDCVSAYEWIREHGPEGSSPAQCVFIAGDSAGGNLTFATLLVIKERGLPFPNGAIPISACTDFTGSGESAITRKDVDPIIDAAKIGATGRGYFGDKDPKDPLLSPLFGELDGLPPLLIQVGDAETLLDDSVRISEQAAKAGVDVTLEIWPEMPHVWHVFAPVLKESVEAIEHIGKFVQDHCGAPGTSK